MGGPVIMELPFHIIIDIFSRLPIRELVSCRCICQTFRNLLSSPAYSLQCLQKTPSTILIRESPQSYNPTVFYPHLSVVDLHEIKPGFHCKHTFELLTKYKVCTLPPCVDDPLQLFGSCNGLLCFYQSRSFRYSVCNPLLGEYVVLPSPSPSPLCSENEEYTYSHYFGFCAKINQYKLIRFISTESRRSAVEILTLGTKTWRRNTDISWTISLRGSFQPLLNGILHFIMNGNTSTDLSIGSFDTEKERFRTVPSPTNFDSEYMKNACWVNAGVYEGCLSLCYVYAESKFEMWVMNKYGFEESWTKTFVVDYNVHQMHIGEKCYPLLFEENGEMWMMYRCLYLHKYNLKTGGMRVFDIHGVYDGFEAITYVPTFISISDVLMGSEFQVEKLLNCPVLLKNRVANECITVTSL